MTTDRFPRFFLGTLCLSLASLRVSLFFSTVFSVVLSLSFSPSECVRLTRAPLELKKT